MRPIPVGAKGRYTLRVTPAHLANQFKDVSAAAGVRHADDGDWRWKTPRSTRCATISIRARARSARWSISGIWRRRRPAIRSIAEADVTKVDGRRIEFKVSARDDIEEIGNGTHERMVVDLGRLSQRLAAKKPG